MAGKRTVFDGQLFTQKKSPTLQTILRYWLREPLCNRLGARCARSACLKMVDTPPTICQLLSGNMIRGEFGDVYVQQSHMISYDSLCANL